MDILKTSIGELARTIPGATRVFHSYRLDFCCGGEMSLIEAADRRGADAFQIAHELKGLLRLAAESSSDWSNVSNSTLIQHITERFHDRHREQLPELIRLARRVEQVHAKSSECPLGLADHLDRILGELETHMSKEEHVLFPMLSRVSAHSISTPISVMRQEHDEHGVELQKLEAITNDITEPAGACNTWRALYTGLRQFREDLMEHIHLENNILFNTSLPRGN